MAKKDKTKRVGGENISEGTARDDKEQWTVEVFQGNRIV